MAESDPYEGTTLKTTTNVVDFTLKVECERIYGQYLSNQCTKVAFLGSATTLESVTFPYGSKLKEISECAFFGCLKLSAIDFSHCELLTTIGQYAFSGCATLSNINLPKSLSTLSPYCFQMCKIQSISIPKSVKAFQSGCFDSCTSLIRVDIPSDSLLERIEWRSLRATRITSIFVPRYLSYFSGSAFELLTTLTSIDCDSLNQNFKSSGGVLYSYDQTKLIKFPSALSKTFTIPDKVTIIGGSSFVSSIIESVTLNEGLETIEGFAIQFTKLKSISIPDSVTSIGRAAFYLCPIASITFGKGLTNIPVECFAYTSITNVTIPNGITEIGKSAFAGCNKLNLIVLPTSLKTVGGGWITNSPKINLTEGSLMKIDDEQMIFYDQHFSNLITCLDKREYYRIPSTVKTISNEAFKSNSVLTRIEFESSDNLTSIGSYAFRDDVNLSSISIPTSVVSVGEYAFSGCTSLTYISFGSKLTSLGQHCFDGCRSLERMIIGGGSTYDIWTCSFLNCINLRDVNLGEGLRKIEMQSFSNCFSLKSISFPSSLSYIGIYCFSLSGIEEVTFSSSSTKSFIDAYSFSNSHNLSRITLPPNIVSIGENCFEGTRLISFEVGCSVVNISDYAFSGCSSLTTFTINECSVLERIGTLVFEGCTSLREIFCSNSSNFFEVDNGALFNKGRSTLICFPPASPIKYFSFSQNVRSVSSSAFIGCKNLLSVTIPDNSIESIGPYAFSNCTNLRSINIPLCVKVVSRSAFSGCNNLRCGVLVDSTNNTFRRNLIDIAKLPSTSLHDCSLISCRHDYYQQRISFISYTVFILI
ncbi:surface antigen BspA-like [Trichomonas vaginalis G3]|uniref:Surface antigen BspA-like n=1 Tax=Trichomonas vaginalis (strain ATCC PRA-98 / G3) TaxID=412133 RepID=A2FCN8_TRIV3|nr:regulation of response to stimulus [Trichomonas vaginalis G3]EAX97313.1 surface antigen BspA-like [Trichomonas vaginalis G3]KAI5526994.1 regulation of response to stimulus [Trichomonas vaginalis G3]|eukprot:XP_001310243.1 surface antigen BspA-like [Trichomonas vaginalis G3]